MLHLLLTVALAPAMISADVAFPAGTQLNFRGTIESRGEEPSKGAKAFGLTFWVTRASDAGAEVFWLVDERGRGEFPWSERFGRASLDDHWRSAAAGPAVLYDRQDGRSVVPIAWPFLRADMPLAVGTGFTDGKLEFLVERPAKAADRAAWLVAVRDAFGPKRSLKVDQQSPLVLSATDQLTMGRGEAYQLKLEWIGTHQLTDDQLAGLTAASERLSALRAKLSHPAQSQEADWKPEQLALLREQLPALAESAAATPLARLVAAAERDVQLQSGRSDAVAGLGTKFEGRPVDEFSIKELAGGQLGLADLAGHVTVLHFWDYRDEPLKEPYGQVGYLDFMVHRRKGTALQVYGVAVDGRLGDEKTRGAAERSIKKLKSFMNLSYPVLLDSGSLIKQFGDPRLVGANLPLFVVIGPDQKIIHYHVGTYDVHQDQGLKELDQVVLQALQKK